MFLSSSAVESESRGNEPEIEPDARGRRYADTYKDFKVGDSVAVKGEHGVFVIKNFVFTENGNWIDCYGGMSGRASFRSFSLDRIKKTRKKWLGMRS